MPIRGMFLSALAEIRVGKIRVLLSAFCVACLVATVTVVAAVGGVTQQVARDLFEQQTGRPGTMLLDMQFRRMNADGVPAKSLRAMKDSLQRFGIVHSPYFQFGQAQIRTADRQVFKSQPMNGPPKFMLTVTDHRLQEIDYLSMKAGRWFNATDDVRLEPSIVATEGFARLVGLDPREAIGARIEFAAGEIWQKARIVGLAEERAGGMMGPSGQIPMVYLPFASMLQMGMPTHQPTFKLRIAPEHSAATITRLKAEAPKWGVDQIHVQKTFGNFMAIGGKLRLLLMGVTAAMLLLGSLPVIALGIFAVRQRRSEFGVHRCFGATGPDLFLTVLLEGLIVCFAAGLAGVSAGYLVQGPAMGILMSRYFGISEQGIDTSFPWDAALLGLGVAVCVGVFTGLIPAWRAMQRSVIRAIRS
ncbi:ABC transporter permease [Actinocorallia aurantiaca]|uniref:ABC transport system permease protein n=1 Tax=Actinocorallia aurantiaca TaxID=46204 RepID=A0ABP6G6Z5_9ACTN